MLETSGRLRRDVFELLDSLRALGGSRYAAVFDARALVAESPAEPGPGEERLHRLVRDQSTALLRVPAELQRGGEMADLFDDCTADEFLLAVVNGRVGVLVACADAARLEAESERLLRALVDRLLRLDATWRIDERGRGLFFGSPRLDTVVIPRPTGENEG
jgi:hypothetical protein